MKKRFLTLPLALTAMVLSMSGAQLAPDAALQRARLQCAGMSRAPGASALRLKHTFMQPGEAASPAMYLFTPADDKGFMLVSADDCTEALIGYSASDTFDPSNMPPALTAWLDACAQMIQQASLTQPAPMMLRAPEDQPEMAPIAPIMHTKWDQDWPYNSQCPELDGRRAYTGCVATAAAQIAKVHQWPVSGTGFREYIFEYNGEKYTDNFDFSTTTFDWEQMTDTYTSASTPEQCQAVATLMHACGVAAQMSYGTTASGTSAMDAAQGLVTYLNYDKGLTWRERCWFTDTQWSELLYSELAHGRPVMLTGVTITHEGHAFVCDGYAEGLYYHINWGWGGLADGYYSLLNLNPEDQGIGGSDSNMAFNFEQSVIMGIQPPVEGSTYVPMMYTSNFMTTEDQYERAQDVPVYFDCDYFNMALTEIEYEVGIRLTSTETGDVEYISFGSASIPSMHGIGEPGIWATALPVGTWTATPVFRTEGTDWTNTYYDLSKHDNKIDLEVTDDLIRVLGLPVTVKATYKGFEPTEEGVDKLMNGHTYNFTYNVSCNDAWTGTIYCVLSDASEDLAVSSGVAVEFDKAGTHSETFTLTIPADLEYLPDNYMLSLAIREPDGSLSKFGQKVITIEEDSNVPHKGHLTDVTWLQQGEEGAEYYPGHTYDMRFDLTASGYCSYSLACVIFSNGFIDDISDYKDVVFTKGETRTEMWSLPIRADRQPDNYFIGLVDPNYNLVNYWPITITMEPEDVETEVTAAFKSWLPMDETDTGLYPGHSYIFSYEITAEGPWNGSLVLTISHDDIKCSQAYNLNFPSAQSCDAEWQMQIPEDMPLGECQVQLVAIPAQGESKVIDERQFTVVEPEDGIHDITVDGADSRYYDLQGMPVANPTPGAIYIRVDGDRAIKVRK